MKAKSQKSFKLFVTSFAPLVVVTLISCAVFAYIGLSIINNNVQTRLDSSMNLLIKEIDDFFSPVNNHIESLAFIAEANASEQEIASVIHDTYDVLGEDFFLYYATDISRFHPEKGGMFVNSADWIAPPDLEPRTRGWFTAAVANNGAITYGEPYVDEKTKALCITASRAVYQHEKAVGVVGIDISLNQLTNLVKNIFVSPNSLIVIVDQKGLFLTNKNPDKIMTANYFEEYPAITEVYTPEEYLDGKTKILHIGNRFYGVQQLIGLPWYILIEGPLSDFNAAFHKRLIIVITVLLLLSCCGAVINSLIIQQMQKKERILSKKLFEETQNLAVATKQTEASSQDSNAAVKEIVATMEDSNALSENITTKIKDVSQVAQKTTGDVSAGVASVKKNVEQLQSIFTANQQTIDGLKTLGEKIESIWDIVTLINSIADQSKIIAFNTELEVSSAGAAGEPFRIVANEIRRLSDGIIDGTKEIKENITEIQKSADSLILSSENETEKINAGYENAKELEENFASIKMSSEITATSAQDITEIIQQQALASEQILIALKQIAGGIENFSAATENISQSAENLRGISEDLNSQMTPQS